VRRVLVANRGEIATRIVRACFDEGIECVAAVSSADRHSLPALLADRMIVIGPAAAAESYLSVDRIVSAALVSGCDAIHPGYGFLSERPELAAACKEHGIAFVGPPAEVMRRAGDKLEARSVARSIGIPTGGESETIGTLEDALAAVTKTGYPVMLKASAGGGGRGMAILQGPGDLDAHFARARAEAQQAFGDGRLYAEPYIPRARHVEVQVLADTHGKVVHLGDRDCSCQRRYQKLIEEAPAPGLPEPLVESIRAAAVDLARALEYVGAGTVEFLVDTDTGAFIFLEVNARVQVEHPVTEAVTDIDIVREQLRIAAGEPLSFDQSDVTFNGHAVECRINAEDPYANFVPTPGLLTEWVPPQGSDVRVDTHCRKGAEVPPYYDSLVAKLITRGDDRAAALALMRRALARFRVEGIKTTIPLHRAVLDDPAFDDGPVTTRWLEETFIASWNGGA
jgi:acetyl-CoA carboxylase, biotin carboxylase subunit